MSPVLITFEMVTKQTGDKTQSQELGQDSSHPFGPITSLRHQSSPRANLGQEDVRKAVRRALGLGVQDMISCPGVQASVFREPSICPASDPPLISVVTATKQGLGA